MASLRTRKKARKAGRAAGKGKLPEIVQVCRWIRYKADYSRTFLK